MSWTDEYDAIVICSTLNQMVNYIPIMQHEIASNQIYNIRMKNHSNNDRLVKKFNYDNWDKNLENVLNFKFKEEQMVSFGKDEILNHNAIINHIDVVLKEKIKEKKVVWNITGGQRHFAMAIKDYVDKNRHNDTIMYYDGDREKIYYYNIDENDVKSFDLINEKLKYKMTIPKALRLMGFEVKDRADLDKPSRYYFERTEDKDIVDEHDWYRRFSEFYCDSKNIELRNLLINSNRFEDDKEKDEIVKTVFDKVIKEIKEAKLKPEIKSMFMDKADLNKIKDSINNHANGKVFGYMLEKMTLYTLMDIIKSDDYRGIISDIDADISVKATYNDSNTNLDQFDVMLATKTGKIIMLECKSGGMDGDNAKSNNYSTYAIAGAYGNPIIVTPRSSSDININNVSYESKVYKTNSNELELTKNTDVYKYIRQAINSAERASLDVKCIDCLYDILKDYKNLEGE